MQPASFCWGHKQVSASWGLAAVITGWLGVLGLLGPVLMYQKDREDAAVTVASVLQQVDIASWHHGVLTSQHTSKHSL